MNPTFSGQSKHRFLVDLVIKICFKMNDKRWLASIFLWVCKDLQDGMWLLSTNKQLQQYSRHVVFSESSPLPWQLQLAEVRHYEWQEPVCPPRLKSYLLLLSSLFTFSLLSSFLHFAFLPLFLHLAFLPPLYTSPSFLPLALHLAFLSPSLHITFLPLFILLPFLPLCCFLSSSFAAFSPSLLPSFILLHHHLSSLFVTLFPPSSPPSFLPLHI